MPKLGSVPLAPNPGPASREAGPDKPAEPASRRYTNILLLGLDQRNDERGVPTRSDTMIVVMVDQERKRVAMVSFPRDMWVEIPGYAPNRINVANFLGDYHKIPGGGPALAKKTLEHNFGLKIDYYARIDFRGFEKIVDTLGGVTVNVERPIRDTEYPTEDYGTMTIYIPAGVQHMNGEVALQYARSRHTENDFGRAKRQQRLLLAIKDRALQLDVIPKLPSLMGTLLDTVQTDIPPTEVLRLARLAKEIGADGVSTLVIDEKLATPFIGEGGADLLMPKKAEIRKAIGALMADPVVKEEGARIEVVNGTDQAGLAAKTGEYLTDQGFNVTRLANADRSDYKSTQILLLSSNKKGTANLLAETLRVGTEAVVPQPATSTGGTNNSADIRVILGQDFRLPQQ